MAMSQALKEYRKMMRDLGFKMKTMYYGEKTVNGLILGIQWSPMNKLPYVAGTKPVKGFGGKCLDFSTFKDAVQFIENEMEAA